MSNFNIIKVCTQGIMLDQTKQLFLEYQQELNEDLCFQSFDTEIENPLIKYAAPTGALYIAIVNNKAVGCIALQQLPNNNCEMKRLYVKPNYRKHKIGEALVVKIIEEAKTIGYNTMKLDTLTKLEPAIKLYEKFGFVHTNAYYNNPLINVVYMELFL